MNEKFKALLGSLWAGVLWLAKSPWQMLRGLGQSLWGLVAEFKLSYLPPMMVYLAYGASSLTAIVGTFFVKEYLNLSPKFLAALLFWAGIPWALKVPIGHLTDLMWRWKSLLIYFGAALIAGSLAIMYGLIGHTEFMAQYLSVEMWYVLTVLLAPVGYVLQDVVADAMTVEAVPNTDANGNPVPEDVLKRAHTTMQTLGRVALILGGISIGLLNLFKFSDVESLTQAEKVAVYLDIYGLAFMIPLLSVAGVILASLLKIGRRHSLKKQGVTPEKINELLDPPHEKTKPDWTILGGSFAYVLFVVLIGGLPQICSLLGINPADYSWLSKAVEYREEVVFVGSFSIVIFLMAGLVRQLDAGARSMFVGTALVMFVFRAVPTPGTGITWWQIDVLGFDQYFQSVLLLTGSVITLVIMGLYLRFLAAKSLMYTYGVLTVMAAIFALPFIGMFYGLHEWISALTGGLIDQRTIALIDNALESPLGQVAMIPSLAWTANVAPRHLKATFMAVIASFANVALSASWLGTKWLNEVWVVERGDYTNVGNLLIAAAVIGLVAPLLAIGFAKMAKLKSW